MKRDYSIPQEWSANIPRHQKKKKLYCTAAKMLNEYAVLALMCGKSRCRNNTELILYCPIFSSAYTEPFEMNSISALLSADEAHGRTSEEEEGSGEPSCDRQVRYGTQTQMEGSSKVAN